MDSVRTSKLSDFSEIRKLTAIAISLLLGMVAMTQLVNLKANAESGTGLTAAYYENQDFTGAKVNRLDNTVDFDWDYSSPDNVINPDTYSARWVGSVEPRYSDAYTFHTFSDDGVRLWVNDQLIIDNWSDHPRTENTGSIQLESGKKYPVRLEYYENTGRAVMKLSWSSVRQNKEIIPQSHLFPSENIEAIAISSPSLAAKGLNAEYYNQTDLNGTKITRTDSQINFVWNEAAPTAGIENDTFSVRWTGQITAPASGQYSLFTSSDDGVRLWVNNQLLVNNWTDHPTVENSGTINLEAGKSYPIKMEYFERGGQAVATLSWSGPNLPKQIINPEFFRGESNNIPSTGTATPVSPAPTAPIPPTQSNNQNLNGAEFYTNPYSQAQNWLNANRQNNLAPQIGKIASQPTAQWLGGWNGNVADDVRKTAAAAASQGKTAVFVAYNIPQRDCGNYSAGGVGSYEAYKSWIGSIASGIGNSKALVILEPDAITLMDCLSEADKNTRMNTLRDAVGILKANSNTAVYIDAGHSSWVNADEMAVRLKKSGIDQANGFALNTSNFMTTSDNANFGQQVSSKIGGKHFVIDTSRNGNGPTPDNQWCNPSGRSLGQRPTTNTGNGLIDAYLWAKAPGESDGTCNGGPSAGTFWPEYAADLASKSNW